MVYFTADGDLLHPRRRVHVPKIIRHLFQEQTVRPASRKEQLLPEAQSRQRQARGSLHPDALRRRRGLQHQRLAGEEQRPSERVRGAALPEVFSQNTGNVVCKLFRI